ncbi:MAG: response regulator [Candidatus Hodarchaeales archaeon]
MCVQKSVTETRNGVFEYELLMSYIENDPENLALYMEIYERSRGIKEKVKELIKGTVGRNISPVVVIMARGKKEKSHALRVMTVEDDESIQRMYRMILQKYGIEIISEALDGREALEKYKELKERPEVILLDYNLPYILHLIKMDYSGHYLNMQLISLSSTQIIYRISHCFFLL